MYGSLAYRLAAHIQGRCYYGWVIVGIVFFTNLAIFNINPTLGLFVTPLEVEFGWSRSAIARSITLGTLFGALIVPVLGALADRSGTRGLFVLCGILVGLCFIWIAQVEQAWQFNLLFGLAYGIGTVGLGQLLCSVLVNRWFFRRRGRAMGLVMMGASGGALIFVPLFQWIISTWGWRTAYSLEIFGVMLFVCVPAMLFLVDRPEILGLATHEELQTRSHKNRQPEEAWSLRAASRTPTFWFLLVGAMAGSFPVMGYFIHAIPWMESHGYSRTLASSAWSLFFLVGVFAKLVWGFVIERIGVRVSLVLLFLGEGAGLYILESVRSPAGLFAYAIFNGLAHGPFLQLLSMVWAEYFGRTDLGRILGAVQPSIIIAGSLGPWTAGLIFDTYASYTPFMWLALVLTLCAALIFACTSRPVFPPTCPPVFPETGRESQ